MARGRGLGPVGCQWRTLLSSTISSALGPELRVKGRTGFRAQGLGFKVRQGAGFRGSRFRVQGQSYTHQPLTPGSSTLDHPAAGAAGSFRALSGRLEFTFRRHEYNKGSLTNSQLLCGAQVQGQPQSDTLGGHIPGGHTLGGHGPASGAPQHRPAGAGTPCTLHPAPCTLHTAHCTLHPAPCTLHPAP